MMSALIHAHSGLRWVALFLLVFAIFNAAKSQTSGKYEKKDKMINLFAMIMLHIQLLIGLALYFTSVKVNFVEGWMSSDVAGGMYRFYGLEHLLGMVAAIAVVTIGRSKTEKKLKGTRDKHRKILISYSIGLLIILAMIPWPFREALRAAWF
ncbi:MAG: cytochrome B [Crocinitomicaceae bacterium]|nr:cytochrome B [Crocinitomicaceae bacterium]PHR35648.1 MAG: cytochrome B [Fluviicola sp.]